MAQQLLGLPVAKALTERVASRVKALADQGVVPTLAIVRVGEREDDLAYARAVRYARSCFPVPAAMPSSWMLLAA